MDSQLELPRAALATPMLLAVLASEPSARSAISALLLFLAVDMPEVTVAADSAAAGRRCVDLAEGALLMLVAGTNEVVVPRRSDGAPPRRQGAGVHLVLAE